MLFATSTMSNSLRCASIGLIALAAYGPLCATAQNKPAAQVSAAAEYGKLPLSFEANEGQADGRVRFTSHGDGYALFLTDNEAVLSLGQRKKSGQPESGAAARANGNASAESTKVESQTVRMSLVGARNGSRITGLDQLPGRANYFIGSDSSKWHSDVPTYGKVKYTELYKGVDLIYYGNQRQLEYDFIVQPHADPSQIRLHFSGASRLALASNGDLEIIGHYGKIAFQKPVLYQVENGRHETVRGAFRLMADNAVSFSLGTYDRSRPLVIDPVLSYSTYLGGSGGDFGFGVAVDSQGNAYVTGVTYSSDFPVSATAYGPSTQGTSAPEAFVTKLNPTGTTLLYSTYIGGSGSLYGGDGATAIKLDSKGDAFIAGTTFSPDFPVVGGFIQSVNNCINAACSNGFITEVNPTGSNLINSTYIGGGAQGGIGDMVNAMDLDTSGNVYIAGTTASTDFPITSGAYQTTNKSAANGYSTAFVAKLHSTFTSLDYSTFLGGTSSDSGLGLTADSAGNAYAAGSTYSTDFPVTSAAYQKTNKAATAKTGTNAFVTKLDPTGKTLIYSTFLGGNGNSKITGGDAANGIAIDSAGDASIAGSTTSADFPISSAAYQKTNKDEGNLAPSCFVTRLNPAGSSLVYSTFLGGSGLVGQTTGDSCAAVALDASGNAYVVGGTASNDFPVTAGAVQAANNDPTYGNAFLAELNTSGSALLYSTFLGGSDLKSALTPGDFASALALDTAGNVYLTGKTSSSDFPLTKSAFQTVSQGVAVGFDTVFVAKIALGSTAPEATTTKLTSSANPQPSGDAVIFTAVVTPTSGSAYPTGVANFLVDGVQAAAVNLASGSATYTTTTLKQGTHTIEATFAGSANFAASPASLTETITQPVAVAPAFSPAAGIYTNAQSVSLTDSTPGAVIYYTTDGATPTAASTKYSAAIAVSSTETIKAIAIATGLTNSAVASANYTIVAAPAATPTFTPIAGTYTTAQSVTLKDTTTGAVIYYTLNGTTPTTASPRYSAAIKVSATETIKAIAVVTGYSNSAVSTAVYTIDLITPAPTISPAPGTYTTVQTVTMTDALLGSVIYYTTDNSIPTSASPQYTNPLKISASVNFKAIAIAPSHTQSAIAAASYVVHLPSDAAPTFNPPGGTHTSAISVTLASTTAGAVFYYTTDGSTPTTASTKYAGRIVVPDTETIKAIAISTGHLASPVASCTFSIHLPAATPTLTPVTGTYAATQTVSISDATAGASIYYTITGATPTISSARYTAPFQIGKSTVVKAVAIANGYSLSAIGSANYVIHLSTTTTATPTFTPAPGSYTGAQRVTLADSTPGAAIYYTTNGTTPTTASAKYSAAIPVSATETIHAIAVATGYANSAVVSGAYTIEAPAATPTFSVAAGTYAAAQSVTLSDTTTGASLYYTTNGATPTTASTKYSTAIAVSATETIKAIAVATGYANSAVASAAYTIETPAATPTFSLAAGAYAAAQSVTLSDTTTGAVLYYTTNATTPTTASTKYSTAIAVSTTETIKAIAVATGYANSAVASAAYTITAASSITATPGSLTFPVTNIGASDPAQTVTLKNTAKTSLSSLSITVTGTNASSFTKTQTCTTTLAAGASCTVSVTEAPQTEGNLSATLQITASGTSAATVTLGGFSGDPNSIAPDAYTYKISTSQGDIYIELQPQSAPKNVANFLSYVNNGTYTKSIIHRVIQDFIVQGGGYKLNSGGDIIEMPTSTPVAAEVKLSNLRGTLATASAGTNTDQFFFNVEDNTSLDTQDGGYTVFAKIVGVQGVDVASDSVSLAVMDAINFDNVYSFAAPFNSIPLLNYTDGAAVEPSNYVYINSITKVTAKPDGPATPVFSIGTGTYNGPQTVSITDSTSGATIYYYLFNSNAPYATVYTGPFTISASQYVVTFAEASGYSSPSYYNYEYIGIQ